MTTTKTTTNDDWMITNDDFPLVTEFAETQVSETCVSAYHKQRGGYIQTVVCLCQRGFI